MLVCAALSVISYVYWLHHVPHQRHKSIIYTSISGIARAIELVGHCCTCAKLWPHPLINIVAQLIKILAIMIKSCKPISEFASCDLLVLSKILMCSFFTAVGYLLLTSFGVFCSCRIGMERQLCLAPVEVDMLKQPVTARPRVSCWLPKQGKKEYLNSDTMRIVLTGLTLQYGQSALWWASDVGGTECVKVLVEYGAQVDLPVRHNVQK